ncbi:hypothetical protein MRX96_025336 [Rhipicephalus microplus]
MIWCSLCRKQFCLTRRARKVARTCPRVRRLAPLEARRACGDTRASATASPAGISNRRGAATDVPCLVLSATQLPMVSRRPATLLRRVGLHEPCASKSATRLRRILEFTLAAPGAYGARKSSQNRVKSPSSCPLRATVVQRSQRLFPRPTRSP